MRYQPDQLILFGVSYDAQRIASLFYRLDGFLVQAAQKDDASICVAQVLRSAVEDRSLAFLRGAVLVLATKPADRVVPAIDAESSFLNSFGRSIGHNRPHHLAIDDSATLNGVMNCAGVVHGHAPA